jgi:hypothetical protein
MNSPAHVDTNERSGVVDHPKYIPRASRACNMCRAKKAKCDQQTPCSFCQKHSFDCTYSSHRDSQSKPRPNNDNKSRKRRLQEERARGPTFTTDSPGNGEPSPSCSGQWDEQDVMLGTPNSMITPRQLGSPLFSVATTVHQADDRKSTLPDVVWLDD